MDYESLGSLEKWVVNLRALLDLNWKDNRIQLKGSKFKWFSYDFHSIENFFT